MKPEESKPHHGCQYATLLPLLLFLLWPVSGFAQFAWTNINGAVTITAYTGSENAVTIPGLINGLPVTSIGYAAFKLSALTNITVPDSVTSIGDYAFSQIPLLSTVVMGRGVTNIGTLTFMDLNSGLDFKLYFKGNIPVQGGGIFLEAFFPLDPFIPTNVTVYYLPGTSGWGATYCGVPTALWNPQAQTQDGKFGLQANGFGFNITGTSNGVIVVEACANPVNPVWFPVQTNRLNGGPSYFSDAQWTNYSGRFYRFRSP